MSDDFVAIVKSGGANFTSIVAALTRLGAKVEITSNPQRIKNASHVILPGVGAAGHAMKNLHNDQLVEIIRNLQQPVLGICLGQQLLCSYSEENDTECLGIIATTVNKLINVRIIPHMGWNNLNIVQNDFLLDGITDVDDFYFVHSFACEIKAPYTIATCNYGVPFSVVIRKDNFYGVQFHPEKSGAAGSRVLTNFLKI